ncbi:MAG TPA: hypothetical protein H9733_06990 [Candidatus Anaerotignum merdipullorum]|nr:hypothetical protein [Candidatus Anaerotignum merdipullorum]
MRTGSCRQCIVCSGTGGAQNASQTGRTAMVRLPVQIAAYRLELSVYKARSDVVCEKEYTWREEAGWKGARFSGRNGILDIFSREKRLKRGKNRQGRTFG